MTVLEAIKSKEEMPKEIWNGSVFGPMSYDDPFEILFWYQEKQNGPLVQRKIKIKSFEIKDEN